MIRVVICDDQDVVREGLRAIIGTATGVEVVGLAANGTQAVEVVGQTLPHVVLMDLNMPGVTGVQATHTIRQRFPSVRVLVLSTYDADEWVFDAIRAGASGYLLKDTPRAELLDAIVGTAAGKTFVDAAVAGKLFARIATPDAAPEGAPDGPPSAQRPTGIGDALSDREREVLRLLARGLSNKDIAAQLFLSQGTVRNHVSVIFEKLGVADRTQAALLAVRSGLAD